MLSRRNFLLSGSSALLLAGCANQDDWAGQALAAWNQFVDQVTALVAAGCNVVQGFIPTVQTIANVVNVLFPGVGTAIGSVAGAVTAVANAICSAMPANPTAALLRRLAQSTPSVPTVIGVINVRGSRVQVVGYSRRFGHRRYYGNPMRMLHRY